MFIDGCCMACNVLRVNGFPINANETTHTHTHGHTSFVSTTFLLLWQISKNKIDQTYLKGFFFLARHSWGFKIVQLALVARKQRREEVTGDLTVLFEGPPTLIQLPPFSVPPLFIVPGLGPRPEHEGVVTYSRPLLLQQYISLFFITRTI